MRFHLGDWVVYTIDGPRTGRIEAIEHGIGLVVEDQDTAMRHLVSGDAIRAETEVETAKRIDLGYYAQDLS